MKKTNIVLAGITALGSLYTGANAATPAQRQADKAEEFVAYDAQTGKITSKEGNLAGLQSSALDLVKKALPTPPQNVWVDGQKLTFNGTQYNQQNGTRASFAKPITIDTKDPTAQNTPAVPTENVDSLSRAYLTNVEKLMNADTSVTGFTARNKAVATVIDSLEARANTLTSTMGEVLKQNYGTTAYWKGIKKAPEDAKKVQSLYQAIGMDVDASGNISDAKTKAAVKNVNDRIDPKSQNKSGQDVFGTDSRANLEKVVGQTVADLKTQAAKAMSEEYKIGRAKIEYIRATYTELSAGEAVNAGQSQTALKLLTIMHDNLLGQAQTLDPANQKYSNTQKRIQDYIKNWTVKGNDGFTGEQRFAKEVGTEQLQAKPVETDTTKTKTASSGFWKGLVGNLFTTKVGERPQFSAGAEYTGRVNEYSASEEGIQSFRDQHNASAEARVKLADRVDAQGRAKLQLSPSTDSYAGSVIGKNFERTLGFDLGVRALVNQYVSGMFGAGYENQKITTQDKIIGQEITSVRDGMYFVAGLKLGNQEGVGRQPASLEASVQKSLFQRMGNPDVNTRSFRDDASALQFGLEGNTPAIGYFLHVKNGVVQNVLEQTYGTAGLVTSSVTDENIKAEMSRMMGSGILNTGYTLHTKHGDVSISLYGGIEGGKSSPFMGAKPNETNLGGVSGAQLKLNL